jgi:hypothetical protein
MLEYTRIFPCWTNVKVYWALRTDRQTPKQPCHAYKLATTYKMTLMYFLVNIHINNQSTLYIS